MPTTQSYVKDVTVSMSKSSECPAISTTKSPSNELSTSSTTPKRTADQPSDTNINVYMGKPFIASEKNMLLPTSEKYTLPSVALCPPVLKTTPPSDDPTISSSTVNKLSVTDINVSTGIPSKRARFEKCVISSSVRATSDSAIPSRSSSKTVSTDDKTDDVQILGMTKTRSVPLDIVLQYLHVKKHSVKGDGSCLYHSVAHQAGLVNKDSQGDEKISQHLRQLVLSMMWKYPDVRQEGGLSKIQWFQKRQEVLDMNEWGGDVDLRLLAIGLHKDIVVLTASGNENCTFARRFPCQPPPVPKMRGGIFVPLTTNELCSQWNSMNPSSLLTIFNGQNHYDSTIHL